MEWRNLNKEPVTPSDPGQDSERMRDIARANSPADIIYDNDDEEEDDDVLPPGD